jgi:hypothetical protein
MVGMVYPRGPSASDVDFYEKVSEMEAYRGPKHTPFVKVLSLGCNRAPLITNENLNIRYGWSNPKNGQNFAESEPLGQHTAGWD